MDSSNTVEVISSSMSMQHNQYTLPSLQPSDTQMTDYLASHEPPPSPPHDTLDNHTLPVVHQMSDALDDDTTLSTLMWVPADRHPEIAPGEFTKWLETNGTNTRKPSIRRKSSALTIHSQGSLEFDRHSPTQDTSRVLTKGTPSLLRRKAFSARGRERQPPTSRHGQHPTQQSKAPVRLYDRPVSMNEWVDLGSASLSQDILSRVHDAESQFLSQPKTNDIHKLERKSSSWFGGFFDKEKKRGSRVEDEHYAQKKQQPRKKSFFSPHLLKFQQQMAPLLLSKPSFSKTLRPPSPPLEEKQQPMVYHSYRLPIHVERAIYRLSHYKLADPRRPLQHQVVISNLMFWYLSQQHPSPTLINNKSTNTIMASGNTNKSLHAHFDDRTKKDLVHKGHKSGRIGIPKPRPYKVTPIDQRRKMDTNDTKDDDNDIYDDDDGDDDLPLSYYKQSS